MKLSTRCRYGVRALMVIAKNYGRTATKRKEIAKDQNLSNGYLENILSSLKEHKFVYTQRGAEGGFFLSKPPGMISLYDILKALEGSLIPVDCIKDPSSKCERIKKCGPRNAWLKLYEAQVKVLSEIKLQDLVDMENEPEYLHYEI